MMFSLKTFYEITVIIIIIIGIGIEATEINNKISAGPVIECDDEMMVMKVQTANPFSGRVYVKGEYANPDCVSSYVANPSGQGASITVPYNKCNVKRLRMSSQGIQYTAVVVVSFHSVFETKVDRAYKINCVFQQINNTFTAPSIEVSMIPTTELTQNVGQIQCMYEVRRGSIDGPQVRYALIGEAVYHVWKCESTNMRMLVRDCFVDDGQGNKVVTIDSSGCTTDRYVLQTPTYMGPEYNMVWTESHVFKYADRPQVVFQCQIHMCDTAEPECQAKSPPTCNGTLAPTVGPTPGVEGLGVFGGRNRTLPTVQHVTSALPQTGAGPFGNVSLQNPVEQNVSLQYPIEQNRTGGSFEFTPTTAGLHVTLGLNESGVFTNVSFHPPIIQNETGFANVSAYWPFSSYPFSAQNVTQSNETFANATFTPINATYLPTTVQQLNPNFSFPSGYGSRPSVEPSSFANLTYQKPIFANVSRNLSEPSQVSGFANVTGPIGGFSNVSRHSLETNETRPPSAPSPNHRAFVDVFDSPLLSETRNLNSRHDSSNLNSRHDSSSFRLFRRSLKDDPKRSDSFVWDVLSNEITVMELDDEKNMAERKDAKEKAKSLSFNSDTSLGSAEEKDKPRNSICIPGYGFALTVGISIFSVLLSTTISIIMCSSKNKKKSIMF